MVYNEILFVNGLIIQWYLNRYTDNTILLFSYLNKTIPDALVMHISFDSSVFNLIYMYYILTTYKPYTFQCNMVNNMPIKLTEILPRVITSSNEVCKFRIKAT